MKNPPFRILLLTGRSSKWHNWRVSSAFLERILVESGRFSVETVAIPDGAQAALAFAVDWLRYDAVALDYEGDDWSPATRASFESYMREGGGLAIYHASDNAFPDWRAFNEMIGVGGWGGRDERAGPKLRWRDGRAVRDDSPGVAMHPKPFSFAVTARSPEHPIMRGLPADWRHAPDELYSQLRGPAEDVEILATARADPAEIEGGTGEHEPVLMAIRYGKGRVFHTTLGHVAPADTHPPDALRCPVFVTTFLRGVEWAASGAIEEVGL